MVLNNRQIAKFLIESKCDINRKNQGSMTPLHLACERGNIKMVKLLLFMGANYNLTNFVRSGSTIIRDTPRETALINKQMNVVELLDKYDAHLKNKEATS
eukprot:TRINITY_DN1254_c0_g4_i2.p2 TRINITY_DN1254_c0_g4~~TRINITY_DN1254_c0_g4_i2.p2  ORF type:complete len:100 (+),score=10.02 TRINITY_DN1254_c0_g4_i2:384-683(+)